MTDLKCFISTSAFPKNYNGLYWRQKLSISRPCRLGHCLDVHSSYNVQQYFVILLIWRLDSACTFVIAIIAWYHISLLPDSIVGALAKAAALQYEPYDVGIYHSLAHHIVVHCVCIMSAHRSKVVCVWKFDWCDCCTGESCHCTHPYFDLLSGRHQSSGSCSECAIFLRDFVVDWLPSSRRNGIRYEVFWPPRLPT